VGVTRAAPRDPSSRATQLGAHVRPYLSIANGLLARGTELAGERVGAATPLSAVSAADILSNYTRGWVLFGLPRGPAPFVEWRTFGTRAIITPETAHVPRRLRRYARRAGLEVRFGEDFDAIIELTREGRSGWLTPQAAAAYRRVHALGLASTVAAYRDGRPVGGVWGVSIGRTFGGMSMFHLEDHAGAVALAALVTSLRERERWTLVDCGGLNQNLARFGAHEIPTAQFCRLVWQGIGAEPLSPRDAGG